MSYSTVAVPWTYPHQPAQALGDSGLSSEDKIYWYTLLASPFIGAAVGYGVSIQSSAPQPVCFWDRSSGGASSFHMLSSESPLPRRRKK